MDPNQPQPNFTPDYLNQIAIQPTKSGPNKKLLILGGLGLAAVLVIVISLLLSIFASHTAEYMQRLTARLDTTQTIANGAQTNIKSSELRSLNSNLQLYFTNTLRDISIQLKNEKIDPAILDKKIVASEAATDMINRLEDGRLNAVYDRTYAREMAYQLESVIALIDQVESSTGSQSLKSFLDSARSNLQPTQTAFSDFNAANG
jgi:hypothetical protein